MVATASCKVSHTKSGSGGRPDGTEDLSSARSGDERHDGLVEQRRMAGNPNRCGQGALLAGLGMATFNLDTPRLTSVHRSAGFSPKAGAPCSMLRTLVRR